MGADYGSWTATDTALILALELHEKSIHKACGHYVDEAFDPDRDGWYEVDDSTTCQACAAMDRYRKDQKNPEPGVQAYVKDEREED